MSERETRTPHGASLRTCPFCGGEAKYFDMGVPNKFHDWGIVCTECGIVMICPVEESGYVTTKKKAWDAWNRRATGKKDARGEMIYAGDERVMTSTGKRGTAFYSAEDAAFEVKLINGVCIGLDAESGEYERVGE